jgi:starch synthase (maltosyl-transferring)
MGFDVLYLPPIHPIGAAFRKGKNNAPTAQPGDVGSPWAIGAAEGGHKSIHPALGTFADFDRLVAAAGRHGVEIALDLAFQCSPDHPYVREHPEWFRHRPDGTIQYAENPPKKYQDIYPFDFECDAWESLWRELLSVVLFWADRGVSIFRVDNPHTKAFPFWEWMIAEAKRLHPGLIFLAEAFTRPKVMYRLAKLGFSQSYTYFAWRNRPWEIEQYFTELARTRAAEFFRPSAWPNTPDILTDHLQHGGRPAAMARLVLAATLCASYGIYGPAFELGEAAAREPGSEEYLDSEKYQQRTWDLDRPGSLREFITRVNRIRRQNPALQQDRALAFHRADNPSLVCYSKRAPGSTILCVVNIDPHAAQSGTLTLDLPALGLDADRPFQAHDLLTDARFSWRGPTAWVGLDPGVSPAHIFRVRTRERTEHDFEYYL